MTPADVRRMVGMVRAIRAGKWTDEPPSWVRNSDYDALQLMSFDSHDELRAVQTAEAFILLAHSSDMAFDEPKFLRDCGFTR